MAVVTRAGAAGLGRATGVMALGSAVSRATGFLRTAALAAAIGFGLVGDAYNTANLLPTLIYELLLGGLLSSVVVPLLVHARRRDGDGGDAYTQRLLTLIVVAVTAVTLLAVLAAPALTWLYGIRDDPAQVALTTLLTRIMLVEIVFYAIYGALGAVLNSRGVFGPPAWSPVLNNLVVIGTCVAFVLLRGAGELTPAGMPAGGAWLLGIGTTVGIAAQAAVLLPALRRVGLRWRWRFDWRAAGLAEAGRLGAWVLVDAAISQAGYLVITSAANTAGRASGVGSAVYANAHLLLQMPYGIIGVALLTALLPRMSRAAAAGDTAGLLADLSLGSRLTAVALVPVTAALIVLGPALSTVVFARGEVSPASARTVGTVLAVSAFGLVPMAIGTLQRQVCYALKDARTPAWINAAMAAVLVPACLLVPRLLAPGHVVAGLAVAYGGVQLVGLVLGRLWLRHRFGPLGSGRVGRTVARLALLSAFGAAAGAAAVAAVTAVAGRGVPGSLLAVLAGTAAGLAAGWLAARFVHIPEVRAMSDLVRARLTGRHAS
ncbi:murein biosynthesis integral membrane protein MurJ [Actinocatenispora comari]|uniref:Lipid II flippase MurJ n=1 Tax=Actinocatenispora comari TaxID=2807577 RepID=A0A8J4AK17_9ACTN|nr:murein biosynthesis integral membrane protein MurJ [Actinocatenispora comari]GIL30890.1 lipid II flippase MurJ [Actinocatenispora comari]